MNDIVLRIAIDDAEWDRVARFTSALCPLETDDACVWLEITGGERRWFADADDLAWSVDGGTCDADETGADRDRLVAVPARAVWFAARLAAVDGVAGLTVDGSPTIVVDSPTAGRAAIDAPPNPTRPRCRTDRELAATGEVELDRLQLVVRAVATPPPGLDPDAEGRPLVWLAFQDDEIVAAADWRPRGGRSTFRVPAEATTGDAEAAVTNPALLALVNLLEPADGGLVTIDLPRLPGTTLSLGGDGWTASIGTADTSIGRYIGPIMGAARAAGWTYSQIGRDDGVLINTGTRQIRVELHDGPIALARITTVVATDVAATPAVLSQVNDANGGLANVRLWIDDDRVIAGTDLPVAALDTLVDSVTHLARSVDGFDVFLGGLSEEP